MVRRYYLDTCIWLNWLKKEENASACYWRLVESFLENVKNVSGLILVSTIVLKELSYKAEDSLFENIKQFFKNQQYIAIIKTTPEDYFLARSLESKHDFQLSFYDCLHIAICLRLKLTLITRDRLLIEIGSEYLKVVKPEELIG